MTSEVCATEAGQKFIKSPGCFKCSLFEFIQSFSIDFRAKNDNLEI